MSPRGRHPHNFARAGGRAVAAALTAAKKKATELPVQLPVQTYGGDRGNAERERRASGYTSLRVSKRTRELLELLAEQAKKAARENGTGYGYYYSLGIDEMLYWDALERLAQLPPNFNKPGR